MDADYDVVVFDAARYGGLIDDFDRVRGVYRDIAEHQPEAQVFIRSIHDEEVLGLNSIKEYVHLGSFESDGRSGDPVIDAVANFLKLEPAH